LSSERYPTQNPLPQKPTITITPAPYVQPQPIVHLAPPPPLSSSHSLSCPPSPVKPPHWKPSEFQPRNPFSPKPSRPHSVCTETANHHWVIPPTLLMLTSIRQVQDRITQNQKIVTLSSNKEAIPPTPYSPYE